ncbi:hypothetical protein F2Q68_00044172 [Brassica cretica]|uniref:Uncharacterized protein n=1 Tax=Brassica cretica TaxID=69181 RepID=A0A8S9LUH3_BRACR|nr:hypothetical protein F2Q68_00044172 [Brassica cretica]
MGLDEAFIKIGMIMGHHGRLVFNLIDQEMDGMKLVGQEMKWVICLKRRPSSSSIIHPRPLQKIQGITAYLGPYQVSTQFKENLRNMIAESLTAVTKNPQQRPIPRPASGDDELSCYQKGPIEEKEKIAAKPAVKIPEIEPALAILFRGEHSAIQLQLEEHVPGALCGLIHSQNKAKEEGELDEALVVHKESLETLIEQGGFIRSFSCDLVIQPFVFVQFNLVEHLRFFKGLQHFVFEPGGSLSVHKSIKNTLVKIATTLKLDFEGSLHKQQEPMVVSADYKLRSRARNSMTKACVWNKLVVKRARSLELIDQGYVILQGLDLRTNPFKGRGNGATFISFKLNSWTSIHVQERQGVTTQPNWLIGELVGLIHEVLDLEKAMGLDEAFIKIGMTMGHHGRLVFNLIDQEMDGMKLVGQEMKWVIGMIEKWIVQTEMGEK